MSMSAHKQAAPKSVGCMVITVSDTRTLETDKSGRLMTDLLTEAGHIVYGYEIVQDDRRAIVHAVQTACSDSLIQAILINGGTGISQRDVTYEAVSSLFVKQLPGFGEIFRLISYNEDIGTSAVLSRATAGVVQNRILFAVPGSTGAVNLAMKRLILPELGHVVGEINKDLMNLK